MSRSIARLVFAALLTLGATLLPGPSVANACNNGSHCVNSIDVGIGEPPYNAQLCDVPPYWSNAWICLTDRTGTAKFKLQQIGGPTGIPVVFCKDLGNRIVIYAAEGTTFQLFEYWWDTSYYARSNCTTA